MDSANLFPTTVLQNSIDRLVLVELKSGMSYSGTLAAVDTWMNLSLKAVTSTMPDGVTCHTMREAIIRGNAVRMVRCQTEALSAPKKPAFVHQKPHHHGGGGNGPKLTPQERKAKYAKKQEPTRPGGR